MSRLQLNLRGGISAPCRQAPLSRQRQARPLQFDIAGTLSQANDPDRLSMDLQINRMDAPKNFFTTLESGSLQMPDLLQASGTLRGTLAELNTDLKINALRGGADELLRIQRLAAKCAYARPNPGFRCGI